jgi:hypothetical protein
MPPVTQAGFASELALPPPYQAVRLREFGDAFAHAATLAPQRGAGTLVYVGRFDVAEFAVVLEPADPLVSGGTTPIESMPKLLQDVMQVTPTTHFIMYLARPPQRVLPSTTNPRPSPIAKGRGPSQFLRCRQGNKGRAI